MTRKNAVSMTSLAMLHLRAAPAEPEVSGDLISAVLISVIFSEIFSEISSAAAAAGGGRSNGPMKGCQCAQPASALPLRRLYSAVRRRSSWILKDTCEKCHGTGAKPGTSPQTCPEVQRQGTGCVHPAVLLWHRCRMCRPVRTVMEAGKVIKDKCPGLRRHRLYFQQEEDRCVHPGGY